MAFTTNFKSAFFQTDRLRDDSEWTVDAVLDDLGPAFWASPELLMAQKNKTLRTKLLAFAAYFGALLAIRRGYDTIVKPLYQHAKCVCVWLAV